MVAPTLAFTAAIASVAAGIYLAAGARFGRQAVTAEARPALIMFTVWWLAVALHGLADVALDLAGAFGASDAGPFLALTYAKLLLLSAAMGGFGFYVSYIRTGSRRYLLPLVFASSAYYATLVALLAQANPVVATHPWGVHLAFGAASPALVAAAVVLPPLAAASAYLTLLPRAAEPHRRARILLVFFGTTLWAVAHVARDAAWGGPLPSALLLASALAVGLSADPPRWLQRRTVRRTRPGIAASSAP